MTRRRTKATVCFRRNRMLVALLGPLALIAPGRRVCHD